MITAQAKVVVVKEKWSFGGGVFKVEPTGFGDILDVWNEKREETPLSFLGG